MELLLDEWSRAADMLFSIHPMDGSLLVWHVDWLDEFQPGMFRQVQVRLKPVLTGSVVVLMLVRICVDGFMKLSSVACSGNRKG